MFTGTAADFCTRGLSSESAFLALLSYLDSFGLVSSWDGATQAPPDLHCQWHCQCHWQWWRWQCQSHCDCSVRPASGSEYDGLGPGLLVLVTFSSTLATGSATGTTIVLANTEPQAA
jgi:hypothetical protein